MLRLVGASLPLPPEDRVAEIGMIFWFMEAS
jgi:hypothetical protein